MEHTEKYLQAKWVVENPKGYDERDVIDAKKYCDAYLEGYNQALSIANVVKQSEQLICECGNQKDGDHRMCYNCFNKKYFKAN